MNTRSQDFNERDNMVRFTRFSFDDGMNVNLPAPRDRFEDDDFEEFLFDERPAQEEPTPTDRDWKRSQPIDRRADRRHLAGADWLKPHSPKRSAEAKGEE